MVEKATLQWQDSSALLEFLKVLCLESGRRTAYFSEKEEESVKRKYGRGDVRAEMAWRTTKDKSYYMHAESSWIRCTRGFAPYHGAEVARYLGVTNSCITRPLSLEPNQLRQMVR
jgi:hypothetical protein